MLTLSTDVICGFPSESDMAFNRTIKLVEEIKPDVLNISRFFPRPKTPAANMQQLSVLKIKDRSKKMTKWIPIAKGIINTIRIIFKK